MQYVGTGRLLVGTSQDVAIGAASAACTNAFGAGVTKIRVKVTSDCRVRIDKTPTAIATDTYMSAGDTEYFTVNSGEKIACIQETAAGKLNVTEIA